MIDVHTTLNGVAEVYVTIPTRYFGPNMEAALIEAEHHIRIIHTDLEARLHAERQRVKARAQGDGAGC